VTNTLTNTKGERIRNLRPRETIHVQYMSTRAGCRRSEECSASQVLNEKVVAAVGIMNAGSDRGMQVIVPTIIEFKRTTRDSRHAS